MPLPLFFLALLLVGLIQDGSAVEQRGSKKPIPEPVVEVLEVGGGVLPAVLNSPRLRITGPVTLDRDVLGTVQIEITERGLLNLGGHRLACGALVGDGVVDFRGGRLDLPTGTSRLTLEGPGTAEVGGAFRCAHLKGAWTVIQGRLFCDDRAVTRVRLQSPLNTQVSLFSGVTGDFTLEATVAIPQDAPSDLGLGAFRTDLEGRWFQRYEPGRLIPGVGDHRFALGAGEPLAPEGHDARWNPVIAAEVDLAGLYLFSTAISNAEITIDARLVRPAPRLASARVLRLLDLDPGPLDSQGRIQVVTGRRWEMTVRPSPYPTEPSDPEAFRLDLTVTSPDGEIRTFAGFHDEPTRATDAGNREEFTAVGPARFAIRFRARQPGRHTLRLTARWPGAPPVTCHLPDLQAKGPPWDDIVRVDAQDPRFFSAGGKFVWPAGCNLNSIYDQRSKGCLATILTPDRGSFARGAYLERLATGGGSGGEIWMSPWNLGLEWIPRWPGYRGAGRYHPGHALALDRFLDRAEAHGMRFSLCLFNHGMARDGNSAEDDWRYHPYNRVNGGWLEGPAGLFEDPRAFVYQQRFFRYLTARWGDSPAILGWKLWAEVNLARGPRESIQKWHQRAAAAVRAADPWDHPVTTNWCGDFHAADPVISALPDLGYLSLDAYHDEAKAIASLLHASLKAGGNGKAFLKPIVIVEFGGSSSGAPRRRMATEHAIGPWAAMVSGHAAGPMLWWFEWIDQDNRFGVYGAINRFLAGEDLRGTDASSFALGVEEAKVNGRSWSRPGRMLLYLHDPVWAAEGGDGAVISQARVVIGDEIAPGDMQITWWDPDLGTAGQPIRWRHPGGRLALAVPSFQRHTAAKLIRFTGSTDDIR